MSLPSSPEPHNLNTLYEIGLFLGVVGTLILNVVSYVKVFIEKRQKDKELKVAEKEVDSKEKVDEANAAAINIKTTLDLLPPLKTRIKDLEAQVKLLECEITTLESEIETLTRDKSTLIVTVKRLERLVRGVETQHRKTDKAFSKATEERKEIIDEQVRVKEEKKEEDKNK
jgi:chromosome segregation ATPase